MYIWSCYALCYLSVLPLSLLCTVQLCLGEDHVAVEDVTPAMLDQAHAAYRNQHNPALFHSYQNVGSVADRSPLRAGGSGHVNPAQAVDAFSGQGHRLSETSPSTAALVSYQKPLGTSDWCALQQSMEHHLLLMMLLCKLGGNCVQTSL